MKKWFFFFINTSWKKSIFRKKAGLQVNFFHENLSHWATIDAGSSIQLFLYQLSVKMLCFFKVILHLPKTNLCCPSFPCFSSLEGSRASPKRLARSLNLNLGRIRASAVCLLLPFTITNAPFAARVHRTGELIKMDKTEQVRNFFCTNIIPSKILNDINGL